jgi:hypothetical protein
MERLEIEKSVKRNKQRNEEVHEGLWVLTDAEMEGCKHRAKISGRPLVDHISQVRSNKMAMYQTMKNHRIDQLRSRQVCCLL